MYTQPRIEVNFLQILQNLKFTLYVDFRTGTVITETLMLKTSLNF